MIEACPDSWKLDIPFNINYEQAQQAFTCVEKYDSGAKDESLAFKIETTQQYIDYLGIMTTFYTVMGIIRIIFVLFLLSYMCKRKARNEKMTWFQLAVIWVILVLSFVQAVF
mmetsp:Transcript_12124/g.16465  ORF Transcript_12124/g.16465 Transcript_12124/m.16465 type:complete len:112 (+) Transcript_12124:108-443(+)